MNKKLLVLALAGALSATAATAAEVTMYGKIDIGFAFSADDTGAKAGSDRTSTFEMASGQAVGTRFGLKGWEDLGNGWRVGFVLESGFTSDNGSLAQSGRLFGRQADVRVQGPYGTIKMGRMTNILYANGDTGLFGGNMSPYSVAWGAVPGHGFVLTGNWGFTDNAITYITPNFGGWEAHLQYSFDSDSKSTLADETSHGTEGKSSTEQYRAIALRYAGARDEFTIAFDSKNYASGTEDSNNYGSATSKVFQVGYRHNFDWGKLYTMGQIFRDSRNFIADALQGETFLGTKSPKDGYGINVGTDINFMGGWIKLAVGYMDVEEANKKNGNEELQRIIGSAGYWYNLSKRTTVYGGVGYIRDHADGDRFAAYDDADSYRAVLAMIHNF